LLSGLGFWLAALVIARPALVQCIRTGYRAVAILGLNTLVLFACLEVAARGVFKISSVVSSVLPKPTERLVGEGNARENVSYYAAQDWAERYWYEMRLSRTQRYHPYVGWRRAPFNGQTIEIDQTGVRMTPGADCRANAFKVFAFGESTMWGTGSPSWGTIPAYLQKGLEKLRPGPVCVMNFGESAYVTTQDVITLETQLRSGNVPDVVVFYSITGDIGAAYESGRAGVHANLDSIAARFVGRREPLPLIDRLKSTATYSLIDQLVGKLTIAHPSQNGPTPGERVADDGRRVDIAKLSELIVRDYFGNYKIVRALAHEYGFKYFFFVPPALVLGNKPLTSEEQAMKRTTSDDIVYKLQKDVVQTIERESQKHQNLYSFVHIFDRYDSLIWIDPGHVTPIGNQVIAETMLDVMHLSPQQP
jgi:hypothetical protein